MNAEYIDWAKIWDEKVKEFMKINDMKNGIYWTNKEAVEKFSQHAKKENWKMGREKIKDIKFLSNSRVLDIGSGPGTMAIPLAEKVAHVTAVDSAYFMLDALKQNASKMGIKNISMVHKDWMDINVESDLAGPYDVVIASHSLGMPNIKLALEKMIEACSKYIYIYFFSGYTTWDKRLIEVWSLIKNKKYTILPRMNILYNVLYDMEIYANIEVIPRSFSTVFSSIDEAANYYSHRCKLDGEKENKMLYNYLEERLEKNKDGYIDKEEFLDTKVWWKVKSK